jgi:N-acetylneuraminic acid mutarotase
MPTDLYGAAGASDGTFFYAAGGYSFSSGNTLAVFNRYDPVANTWTPLPDMPQSAIMAVAVYYPTTNKIYVFGGEDAVSGTNYNITRIYDIGTNTWSTGANMPDVRSFSAGGYSASTGKIYIISGYNTGQVTSAQPNTWQYDPVADSWTDLTGTAPFPHPAGGMAFGVINNKLYIAGGRDAANTIINLNWEYDPVANAYTAKADEPGSFQNNVPGSGAAQGLLWVFGGGNPFSGASATSGAKATKAGLSSADVPSKTAFPWSLFKRPSAPDTSNSGRYYNPATDTWTSSPNMNVVRSFTSGGAIGSSLIIAAGGYNGSTTVASAETEGICGGTPTPTPTASPSATPTATATATATATPTATATATATATPTATPTATQPPPTATPTVTPRHTPTPRPQPPHRPPV